MAELTLSPEASKEMESLPGPVRVMASFMLDQAAVDSESAVRVESIAYDAAAQRVNMDARIMPVLTNVNIEIVK